MEDLSGKPNEMTGAIVRQYGAALAMLQHGVEACPDSLWDAREDGAPVWRHAYHALWFLDGYLHKALGRTLAPPSFHVAGAEGIAPPHPSPAFPRENIREYLEAVTARTLAIIREQGTEGLVRPAYFHWHGLTFLDTLIYNLRHVQHHVGQINLVLRNTAGVSSEWIGFKEDPGPRKAP